MSLTADERDRLCAEMCGHCRAGRRWKFLEGYGWVHPGGIAFFDYCKAAPVRKLWREGEAALAKAREEETPGAVTVREVR